HAPSRCYGPEHIVGISKNTYVLATPGCVDWSHDLPRTSTSNRPPHPPASVLVLPGRIQLSGCTWRGRSGVPGMRITVYGCGEDEAALFLEMAPRFGVMPTVTDAAVSEANIELTVGNRCISVGHKTRITLPTLLALEQAGVRYIS